MVLEEFGLNKAIMRYDDPKNLVALFEESVEKYPDCLLFGEKDKNLVYHWSTYQEIGNRVNNLRGGLASLGILKEKDNLGIIANNCSEWAICSFAAWGLNCRWVPMYESELEDTWEYIIKDAEIKLLFVATAEIGEKIKARMKSLPSLKKIIVKQK